MEFATLFFNECSQIPLSSRNLALTRLAQQVQTVINGKPAAFLKPRAWYDCNPPSKAHWTYRLFVQKQDPDTKQPLAQPADYASFKINPGDNRANIADGYLETLEGMSPRLRKRFLDGEFADATPGALFADETIDLWRVVDGVVPDLVRVVVAVDPSGSGDVDNADNDAIGICVAGIGTDGNGYVLEDCTVKAGPATWGRVVASAFDRHKADIVVGEGNYGGAMVRQTVLTARPRTPYKQVTATRGKHVRAEPFSALYEQGKIRHVGQFAELEDELTGFTTNGYLGDNSPNRADALIWALAELFPALVASNAERAPRPQPRRVGGASAWAA
jgi:phage terminase large subunit-like protein